MVSGIGPADNLAAHSIEPVAVSEGVGRNLQDHPTAVGHLCVLEPEHAERRGGVLAMLKASSSAPGERHDIRLFPAVLEPSVLLLDVDLGTRKALSMGAQVAKRRSTGWLAIT